MDKTHCAVLRKEVVEYLAPRPGQTVVDATLGCGGHALEIAGRIGPRGLLIGIDRDEEALSAAQDTLASAKNRMVYHHGVFSRFKQLLERLEIRQIDGILFDLGVSSPQLDVPGRGFSIMRDGPLDMRMDGSGGTTAADIINRMPREKLEKMFREYGEERMASRIARRITEERRKKAITTTCELARLVRGALPYEMRFRRIHPATRVFMALRIAVNNELDELKAGLSGAVEALRPGGRICVISFHSLEDRIVKHSFRKYSRDGALTILTKKPVIAGGGEVELNPRARSAKLRAAEKTG